LITHRNPAVTYAGTPGRARDVGMITDCEREKMTVEKERKIRAAASDDRPIYFWVAETSRPPPESRRVIVSRCDAQARWLSEVSTGVVGTPGVVAVVTAGNKPEAIRGWYRWQRLVRPTRADWSQCQAELDWLGTHHRSFHGIHSFLSQRIASSKWK